MVKFFTCYGMILALNIFVMLTNIVINPNVVFFENGFLNFCMKSMIIIGGAFGLNRAMALVGNLISAGAGSNEMRDAAQTQAKFGRALATPFSPLTAIGGEALQQKKRDLAGRALQKVGLGLKDSGQRNERGEKDAKSSNSNENQNTNSPKYNDKKDGVTLAIANLAGGSNNKNEERKSEENQNDKKPGTKGSNLVNNSINNSINKNKNQEGGN